MSHVLLDLMLRATLLLVVAGGLAAALRHSSAASVHLIWLTALLAVPTLPLGIALLPALPWLPSPTPSAVASDAGVGVAESGTPWLLWVYGAGAVLLLLRVAWGQALLHSLWRKSKPAPEQICTLTNTLAADMGVGCAVAVRLANDNVSPMTWDVSSPKILLPPGAETWDATRLRLVLLHELAHVRRLDSLTHTLAGVVCALGWLHPLVWLASRRLQLLQEQASDDLVLARGVAPDTYCRLLLTLASEARSSFSGAPAMLASPLERRFAAILETRRRSGTGRLFRLALLGGAFGLTGIASAIAPAASAPVVMAAAPLPPVERGVSPAPKRIQRIAPVPPRLVPTARARAIAPRVSTVHENAWEERADALQARDLALAEMQRLMTTRPIPPSRSPALGYLGPSGPLAP